MGKKVFDSNVHIKVDIAKALYTLKLGFSFLCAFKFWIFSCFCRLGSYLITVSSSFNSSKWHHT